MQMRRLITRAITTTFAVATAASLSTPAAFAQTTFAPNSTTPPVISTFAGNGTAGFSGDGHAATSAELHAPVGVAEDSAGDLYIADTFNARIREVNTSGVIKTVAGNGTTGYAGDGGAATKSELNGPTSPALDSHGNLYIADTGNNRVRQVTPSGTITTLAGNGHCGMKGDGAPAVKAELCAPTAVAVESNGTVLIADTGNNEIRMVTPDGMIQRFAGNGEAGLTGNGGPALKADLSAPTSLAIDSIGNVYIADTGNNEVRVVNTSGIINDFAGTGVHGYSGDGGKATSAQLNHPGGVGSDSLGNVYIADSLNFRIRVVIPKGDIFTYAGTGVPGYSGDGGVATAAKINVAGGNLAVDANDVYFTDTLNQRVRRIQGGPPPNIPETPLAILLPLGALALVAGGFVLTRRRVLRKAATTP